MGTNADRNGKDRIHRVAKKLPNPLDPETCLLSRESHRRHISSLVSVAMQAACEMWGMGVVSSIDSSYYRLL
jgi:hypothetical protein